MRCWDVLAIIVQKEFCTNLHLQELYQIYHRSSIRILTKCRNIENSFFFYNFGQSGLFWEFEVSRESEQNLEDILTTKNEHGPIWTHLDKFGLILAHFFQIYQSKFKRLNNKKKLKLKKFHIVPPKEGIDVVFGCLGYNCAKGILLELAPLGIITNLPSLVQQNFNKIQKYRKKLFILQFLLDWFVLGV